MSSIREDKHQLIDWLKSGGLLIITLSGILLYVIFSVPATIFYDRLGTTPSEVGLTYTSLLSGSTLGALALLAAVVIIITYVAFGVLSLPFMLALPLESSFLSFKRWRQIRLTSSDSDDQNFEIGLAYAQAYYFMFAGHKKEMKADWAELETAMRRIRELRQLGALTAEQTSEYESLMSREDIDYRSYAIGLFILRIRSFFTIRRAGICALLVVVTLPVIAFLQAGSVIDGKPYRGSQLGIFDYHAVPAIISPSSTNASQSITRLVGRQLFYLGQNAQYAILYVPESKSTVRIPVTQVVVTSRLFISHQSQADGEHRGLAVG